MRKVSVAVFVLLALVLACCDQSEVFGLFVPKDEAAIGRTYIEDVRTGNFQPVIDKLNPAYKSPTVNSAMQRMAAIFPHEKPVSIKVVGSQTDTTNGRTTFNLTYEYQFAHRYVLAHVYFARNGKNIQIERMDVHALKDSLEHLNAFTFRNKTPLHYAVFILAILLPIFTVSTAIVCFRTPIPKGKWLWVIFVLCGFVIFSLNWVTGATEVHPITVLLLGAGYTREFYGPPIFQIAFPLGAVIFWFRRSRWKAKAAQPVAGS